MATTHLSYGEVKSEVETIQRLVEQVNKAADELMEVTQKCIIRGIQTKWALTLHQNLTHYYDADMKDAMSDMKKQAVKLTELSEEAEKFSNEED